MTAFLAARLLGILGVIAAMTLVVFILQQVAPNDPARALAGPNAPAEVVAQKRIELGLDRPVLMQYALYMQRLARGDLGRSIRTGSPVAADVAKYLPASLELIIAALALGSLGGVLVSLATLVYETAGGLRLALIALASVPIFLGAYALLLIFWFGLGWLPGDGRLSRAFAIEGPTGFVLLDTAVAANAAAFADSLAHLILPAVTLAAPVAVAISRTFSSALQSVLRSDYIRTAQSKGLGPVHVVLRHGVRNALQAPLSMLGLQLGMTFANILVVERIFGWPGLGLYMVQAFASSDLPAILGVSIAFAAIYTLFNLGLDLVQAWADPRIRARV